MLDNIDVVVSTVWRKENYLKKTLDSLFVEYPPCAKQPVCFVVGSPVTIHLDCYRSLPGISVLEMGPNSWSWIKNNLTYHRATWNYYRCLTNPAVGTRGTLLLEDDICFAKGWRVRLDATLSALEGQHGSNFVLALYSAWFSASKERQGQSLYEEYPYESFFGTQAMYYPTKMRQSFAKYLKVHGVVANQDHYDILLRNFLIQSRVPMFATTPCLVQHIGRTSEIQTMWHESSTFIEDITERPFS